MFPSEDFFFTRETKKSLWAKSGNREGGARESCCFLVKNCWTVSVVWAGALINHPLWTGQMCRKSLQKKKSLKPNTASHNNVSWFADTDGLLEHSPSGESWYHKAWPPPASYPEDNSGGWGGPPSNMGIQKRKKDWKNGWHMNGGDAEMTMTAMTNGY